jgi:cobalt-zinc-cadmium efflux system membrane fusion protein
MKIPILFFLLLLVISACAKKNSERKAEEPSNPNAIEFSRDQVKMSEIEWGPLQKMAISDVILCNGIIELPPQNYITISPVMGGTVKDIRILPGMYVKKGAILAILEDPGYLSLQEEFLEASSRYTYQKEEYKRQGELTLEQATSLKKMQMTEADFRVLESKVFSLRKQLQMLGLDPDQLKPENIRAYVEIPSPNDGYITNVFKNRGTHMNAGEKLCDLIDKSHLHLQLNVFEKDLPYVKQNQNITFTPAAVPDKNFTAKVELIGQAVDETNHGIPVHAHVSSAGGELKPGMFVTARIMANPRRVYTLPITALVRKENQFFVFLYDGQKFERTKITTGKEQDQFMEIILPDSGLLNRKFVTRGAYYLESEWEKARE